MYVGDKRGTPLVSVVRVSEGPLLLLGDKISTFQAQEHSIPKN